MSRHGTRRRSRSRRPCSSPLRRGAMLLMRPYRITAATMCDGCRCGCAVAWSWHVVAATHVAVAAHTAEARGGRCACALRCAARDDADGAQQRLHSTHTSTRTAWMRCATTMTETMVEGCYSRETCACGRPLTLGAGRHSLPLLLPAFSHFLCSRLHSHPLSPLVSVESLD